MKQHTIWFLCSILAVFAMVSSTVLYRAADANVSVSAAVVAPVLIDAGHGGVDGGASTADGTLEKTINLAIAGDLRDILRLCGLSVQMTREEDISIHDEGCTTIRQKKVSDMKNRLRLYDAAELVVSIHQNHYSTAKYSGLQVFYAAANPQSRILGTAVQERVKAHLLTDNTRSLKMADKNIYLLHHTVKPAILVECGFLSNPAESERLKTADYQRQMALVIATGVLDTMNSKE